MQDNKFVDYYAMFDLNRTWSEKELKKALGKKSSEISQWEACTSPNDTKTRKELQDLKNYILEAIKILGKADSRKTYDAQLDAALQSGNVDYERTGEAQSILEKARKYFAQERYDLALKTAQEALAHQVNTEEPYEIITDAMFMLGDYEELIQTADRGSELFPNSQILCWRKIRYRILMEKYEDAQKILNEAVIQFCHAPLFMAEQAYFYFYAGRFDVGKRMVEEYIQKNPTDNEYRQCVAYNLLEISNQYYKYDSAAEMTLITEQKDYEECLEIVTLANTYYQDDYTKECLENIQFYGSMQQDKENMFKKNVYIGLDVISVIIMLYSLLQGGGILTTAALLVTIFSSLAVIIMKRYCYLPAWQVNRDYFRGYKEKGDGWIYAIVSMPFDLAMLWIQG